MGMRGEASFASRERDGVRDANDLRGVLTSLSSKQKTPQSRGFKILIASGWV